MRRCELDRQHSHRTNLRPPFNLGAFAAKQVVLCIGCVVHDEVRRLGLEMVRLHRREKDVVENLATFESHSHVIIASRVDGDQLADHRDPGFTSEFTDRQLRVEAQTGKSNATMELHSRFELGIRKRQLDSNVICVTTRDVDVCGGDACIARTRIPVWLLERYRRLGVNERDLLDSYPSLRAEDLANAWAYARIHSTEIDKQIQANEEA